MQLSKRGNLIVEKRPTDGQAVWIIRFARADLSSQLYDDAAIELCDLYKDLHEAALANLSDNEALVFNFGLVEVFTSAFYRFLLKARESVLAQNGRVALCHATSPVVHEVLELFEAGKLFEITTTEQEAVRKVTR